jgi:hypothetical protein
MLRIKLWSCKSGVFIRKGSIMPAHYATFDFKAHFAAGINLLCTNLPRTLPSPQSHSYGKRNKLKLNWMSSVTYYSRCCGWFTKYIFWITNEVYIKLWHNPSYWTNNYNRTVACSIADLESMKLCNSFKTEWKCIVSNFSFSSQNCFNLMWVQVILQTC